MKGEKINHRKARKIVKHSLSLLHNSEKTFRDIFNISFSLFKDNVLFYQCGLIHKDPVTYGEAKKNVEMAAKNIASHFKSAEKNSFIGIYLENSPEWIYSFYGILMAGYRPYLVNTRNELNVNQKIFNELSVNCFISKKQVGNHNTLLANNLLENNDSKFEENWSNEICLSTSGTSGNFKSVIYDGEAISNQLFNSYDLIKEQNGLSDSYHGQLRHLLFLPLYHIFGLSACFLWYSFFGRSFIIPNALDSDSLKFAITYHEATHIFAVPLFWNKAASTLVSEVSKKGEKVRKKFEKGLQISINLQKIMPHFGLFIARNILFKKVLVQMFGRSLKFGITGGGQIDSETLRIFNGIGYKLFNGYGMTEIGITSVERRNNIKYRLLGSVGSPIGSISYKLNKLENGKNELLVNGDSLYSYIHINNVWFKRDKNIDFATGDISDCTDKNYFIFGRKDDLIITEGGENISPDLLESKFKIPFIKNFTILGNGNDVALIYYLGKDTLSIYEDKVNFVIKQTITNNNLPVNKIYMSLNELPVVLDVKVQRNVLKASLVSNKENFVEVDLSKVTSPITDERIDEEILSAVLEIFHEVFPNKEIYPNSNFSTDLGGDSLTYYCVLEKIQNKFKFDASNMQSVPQTPQDLAIYLSNEAKNC